MIMTPLLCGKDAKKHVERLKYRCSSFFAAGFASLRLELDNAQKPCQGFKPWQGGIRTS